MTINRPNAPALLVALVVSAALVGLGYWLGVDSLQARLDKALADADHFNQRAARQEAINSQLLSRARDLERRLAQGRADADDSAEDQVKNRVLRRDQAAIMLGGALVATLVATGQDPAMARIELQNSAGDSGQVALKVGGEAAIRAGGKVYRLILKKVSANSATIALLSR